MPKEGYLNNILTHVTQKLEVGHISMLYQVTPNRNSTVLHNNAICTTLYNGESRNFEILYFCACCGEMGGCVLNVSFQNLEFPF